MKLTKTLTIFFLLIVATLNVNAFTFSDGAETGTITDNWQIISGTPTYSGDVAHSGTQSIKLFSGDDLRFNLTNLITPINISLSFYEEDNTSTGWAIQVEQNFGQTVNTDANGGICIGTGVYCFDTGGLDYPDEINVTQGWHYLSFVVSDRNGDLTRNLTWQLDNFTTIPLADNWESLTLNELNINNPNNPNSLYIDDLEINGRASCPNLSSNVFYNQTSECGYIDAFSSSGGDFSKEQKYDGEYSIKTGGTIFYNSNNWIPLTNTSQLIYHIYINSTQMSIGDYVDLRVELNTNPIDGSLRFTENNWEILGISQDTGIPVNDSWHEIKYLDNGTHVNTFIDGIFVYGDLITLQGFSNQLYFNPVMIPDLYVDEVHAEEITSFTNPCLPEYFCSHYLSCNINNTLECDTVGDQNNCGYNYYGTPNDFDQSCLYIPPNPTNTLRTGNEIGGEIAKGLFFFFVGLSATIGIIVIAFIFWLWKKKDRK